MMFDTILINFDKILYRLYPCRGFQGTCPTFFPTCQVRVARFYQRCCPPPPASASTSASDSASASTACSRSQWALLDLNRELQSSVGTAGPQPRAPDLSGHCRTSTTSSRSQRALPDLNHMSVGTARPQRQAPELNGFICSLAEYISQYMT